MKSRDSILLMACVASIGITSTISADGTTRVATLPLAMRSNAILKTATESTSSSTLGLMSSSPAKKSTTAYPYVDYDKAGDVVGRFPTFAKAELFLNPYPGGWVKNIRTRTVVYRMPDFTTIDLRYPAPGDVTAASINRFLLNHDSPLLGLGASFMAAQRKYGVNAAYLVAHAIEESKWGKSSMAISKDNLYGTGAFTANPNLSGTFPSFDYAIRYQAWVVRKNYFNPGYSHFVAPTLAGMGVNYASDTQWANSIRRIMNQIAVFLGDTVKSYHQYQPGSASPSPVVMSEPTYRLTGAVAQILPDKYYSGAPVYSSIGDGQLRQFSRPLKFGDSGDDVTTLQTALNRLSGTTIPTDGQFGSETEDALKTFQTSQGMNATGICDFSLWTGALGIPTSTLLTPKSTVSIDEVAQGMLGADVVSWMHVRGAGWVDARDVRLANVYRVFSKGPRNPKYVSIPIYALGHSAQVVANLHSGDSVVCGHPTGKYIVIHFVNQNTGKPMVGMLRATIVRLVAEH